MLTSARIKHTNIDSVFKPTLRMSNLIRVGSIFDGCYYLPNNLLYNTDFLISFGCGGNMDFEYEVCIINESCVGLFVDKKKRIISNFILRPLFHLLTGNKKFYISVQQSLRYFHLKSKNKNVDYIQKEVNSSLDFQNIIAKMKAQMIGKNSILKIDIEGAEFLLLDGVIENANLFNAIIIEFHLVSAKLSLIKSFILGLKDKGFQLSQTVINECSRPEGDILEVTFLHESVITMDNNETYFHSHTSDFKKQIQIPTYF